MVYSMGGTHAEAVRRQVAVAVQDVRHSRSGATPTSWSSASATGAHARPHRPDGDRPATRTICRSINTTCCATISPTPSSCSPRLPARPPRDPQRGGARLRAQGGQALPGRDERDGRAGETGREGIRAARRHWRGHPRRRRRYRLLIIGSTPMDNPALIFGIRAPPAVSSRRRYHQHGACRRLSRLFGASGLTHLPRRADRDGAQILGRDHAARLPAHHRRDRARQADREHAHGEQILPRQGVQSRPTQCHGIDLVTDNPTSARSTSRASMSTWCSSPA